MQTSLVERKSSPTRPQKSLVKFNHISLDGLLEETNEVSSLMLN